MYSTLTAFHKKEIFVQPVAEGHGFVHHIVETKDQGQMNLMVQMHDESFRIDLPQNGNIFFLDNPRRADSVIWEKQGTNKFRLHIFELKKTVKESEWGYIKDQFQGAFFTCLCIARLLGWEIDTQIVLHTVYLRDLLTHHSIDNIDIALQEGDLSSNARQLTSTELAKEWNDDVCQFSYPPHLGKLEFRHTKIPLSATDGGIPQGEYRIVNQSNP